jgi:hypothetical protein
LHIVLITEKNIRPLNFVKREMSGGEPLKVEGPSYSADDLATAVFGDIHASHQDQTSPPSLEGSQQIIGPDGGYG